MSSPPNQEELPLAHNASAVAMMAIMGGVFLGLNASPPASYAADQTAKLQTVDDRKAVIANVEPVRQLLARARIGGTITSLAVREGDRVNAGDRIAVIVDQKLLLQMRGPPIARRGSTGQSGSGTAQFRPHSKTASFRDVVAGPVGSSAHEPSMSRNAHFRRC